MKKMILAIGLIGLGSTNMPANAMSVEQKVKIVQATKNLTAGIGCAVFLYAGNEGLNRTWDLIKQIGRQDSLLNPVLNEIQKTKMARKGIAYLGASAVSFIAAFCCGKYLVILHTPLTKISMLLTACTHLALGTVSPPLTPVHTDNCSHLFTTETPATLEPKMVTELQAMVDQARINGRKIALVGAGKSMGGQTVPVAPSDYRISLHKLNKVISLNIRDKEITVQAGMTWRQLQEHIAPHGLSIKAMQSYHDFAIGGSLSVNVHGQALKYAPIIETVLSCTLLQPNGKLVTLSPYENQELFELVIGGYGLFGVIVDVTLSLTDDMLLERKTAIIDSADLANYFMQHIQHNPDVEFYSARFLLTESKLMKKALVVTYEKTNKNMPALFELERQGESRFQKILLALTAKSNLMKKLRFFVEKKYVTRPEIVSRNNFANATIESLPANNASSQYILQEYFIPYAHLNSFIDSLRQAITKHSINMINVTARHVHKDTRSKLSFAKQDCCALVLYIHVAKKSEAYANTIQWTRELIDATCACNGSYYLPYQLLATQTQLETAYPAFKEFVALKRKYDPQEMFVNQLYQQYGQHMPKKKLNLRSRL